MLIGLPSDANRRGVGFLLFAFGCGLRLSTEIATEMNAGHDYGFATKHDVLLALNECAAGDLIACVL